MKTPGSNIPNTVMEFRRVPSVADSAIRNNRNGNAIRISVTRDTAVSVTPP